jgi:NAD(P)-dependent dehydrogenase (short-subunit alcohol dehydrogenase family)
VTIGSRPESVSKIDASKLLRPGLLEGISILLAQASSGDDIDASGSLGDGVRVACAGLGARVCELSLEVSGEQDEAAIEQDAQAAVEGTLADGGTVEMLVVDCASVFARAGAGAGASGGGEGGRAALRASLDATWNVTHAVVNGAFLPDARGGRIVYLAPLADGGEHVNAACAGLENLARTLSIEWARYGIAPVTIAPGAAMRDADVAHEVAALVAYLASPAGAYFSGCLLDLRGARQSST